MALTLRTCGWTFFCLILFAGPQHFWEKDDPASWTAEQIRQFTTASPWAKQVTAELVSNQSNMVTSQQRAESRGRTAGSSATLPSPSALPKVQALVRWASAKPMQQVLRVKLPDSFAGHYVVSVSGLPLSGDTTEIAEETTLQVKRGSAIHPDVAYQDPEDSSTVYFGFLPSLADVASARSVLFGMVAAPYSVRARFNVGEMRYRGASAL